MMNDSSLTKSTSTLHSASDEALARRVQDGCADSFTELVRRLQPRLFFVLRRRLQHQADVEDLAQKTLLRAYEKIHLYDPTRKFSPWLYTIAFRLVTDHHRKRALPTQSHDECAAGIADPEPDPAQQALDREQSSDLWALAERVLKPDQWTALWLLYGEEQSVREIAQTLNRTSVSVRVLLFRARKALAPHLARLTEIAAGDAEEMAEIPLAPQVVRAQS